MIQIGVDAMGGTQGPKVMIPAIKEFLDYNKDVSLHAFIAPELVANLLNYVGNKQGRLDISTTEGDISDSDVYHDIKGVLRAIKNSPMSALVQGISTLKNGEIDAFVTRGNTGALVATAGRELGERGKSTALSAWIPRINSSTDALLLDVGAQIDTTIEHLLRNAELGDNYLKSEKAVVAPQIALLNIGTESYKGDKAYRDAHEALRETYGERFLGNIEANELLLDTNPDIIVTGAMVGNIALKSAEGTFATVSSQIKQSAFRTRFQKILGAYTGNQIKNGFSHFHPDNHPDAILHGISGKVVKIHGGATQRAVVNGLSRTSADLKTKKEGF